MKRLIVLLLGVSILMTNELVGQEIQGWTQTIESLQSQGALELAKQVQVEAQKINKNVSVAIVDASGVTLLLLKGNQVGAHNTEASRRKAFTAYSTKTPTLVLMRKVANSKDAQNLNTLPELLLLGGGVPVWNKGELIGAVGVSGGGSGENDHMIAQAAVENMGYKIVKD